MKKQYTQVATLGAVENIFDSRLAEAPEVEGYEYGRTISVSDVPPSFFGKSIIEFQANLLSEPREITGPLFDDQVNANSWGIHPSDWDNVMRQLNSGQVSLRVNHGDLVEDIVGKVNSARRIGNAVFVTTEILDADVFRKLEAGYLKGSGFSIRGRANTQLCARCGKVMTEGKCEEHGKCASYVKNLKVSEISLVLKPAYGHLADQLVVN